MDPHCAISSKQEWENFVQNANTVRALKLSLAVLTCLTTPAPKVVEAFEFYRFTDHELSLGSARHHSKRQAIAVEEKQGIDAPPLKDDMAIEGVEASDLDDTGGVYYGCKYLTTSRLLRLQVMHPRA